MRRILTSLPYEDRIGIPGAANGLSVADSVRRNLTIAVADTHLDDSARRPAGRLVECDRNGSLLADVKFRGYETLDILIHNIKVDDGPTLLVAPAGYRHLELLKGASADVWAAYRIDSNAVVLQTISTNWLSPAFGVVGSYWVYVEGLAGTNNDILAYHFK